MMLGINEIIQKYRIDLQTAEDYIMMRDALLNREFALPSNEEHLVHSLGVEQEVNILDPYEDSPDLPLYKGVNTLVEEEDAMGLATEIAGHQVECVSAVISRVHEVRPMEAYMNMMLDEFSRLKKTLRERKLAPLMIGNIPFSTEFLSRYFSSDENSDVRTWICPKDRYKKMVKKQNENPNITQNPYEVDFERITGFESGSSLTKKHRASIPMSSALFSLAAQSSMNIGCGNKVGYAANMKTALMPLAPIFSTSRFSYKGISAKHWNRVTYAMKGMGSRETLFKFMVPEYYKSDGPEAILEWLEHCFTRELLLPYDEGGGKRKTFCPYLRTRAGQAWTFSPRITWGQAPNSSLQTIWTEENALDAQVTGIEAAALHLLITGNMAFHYHNNQMDVSKLIPANQIEPVCMNIANKGPYSEDTTVPWDGTNYRADKWVMDRLIPDALEGVALDDLCNVALAEKLFDVLKRALSNRCTGSDWVLKKAREYDSADYPTCRRILLKLSQIQAENEESLSDPKGLFDLLR